MSTSSVQTTELATGVFISIIVAAGLAIVILIFAYRYFFRLSSDYTALSDGTRYNSSHVPREFLNDEESLVHLSEEYDFTLLSAEEQVAYLKAEEFTKNSPPNFHHAKGSSYTPVDDLAIRDRGLNAFEFEQDSDFLQPRYIVEDRTEINFTNNDTPYSCATSVLNYSLPVKNRSIADTVYFETKVFEFNPQNDSHFAIGLVTKPYPSTFRLPGYNGFSLSYESTGNLKINKPLPTPLQQHQGDNSVYNALVLPPLQQSDVVGFGYVIPTGTLFVTHNGKKLMDIMKGCYVDLYPAIGCFQTNAKFQVNFGELGFVWIEANVRKYGFISSSDYKKIKGDRGLAALPEYVTTNGGDKILDKGEELPPRYPEEELDFFGRSTSMAPGTSSQLQRSNDSEKGGNDEVSIEEEPKPENDHTSSTIVTHEPEEVMDLRERIYEQSSAPTVVEETTPLISSDPSPMYESEDKEISLDGETSNNDPSTDEPSSNSDPSRETTPATNQMTNNSDSNVAISNPSATTPQPNNSNKKKNNNKKKKNKNGKKKGKRK
ncbi:protein Ssh4p [[Candida] anglica]